MATTNTTFMIDNLVCRKVTNTSSYSIWQGKYIVTPNIILTIQLSVISLVSRFVELWLQHFGQTSIVSQITAGVLLGPSLLSQNKKVAVALFPKESRVTLATFASFGNMFYHFLIAVRTDPAMMLRPGRAAIFLATSAFFTTMILTVSVSLLFKRYIDMGAALHNSITLIAMTQAFMGVSVVSYLITELKLQNTEIGRLSLSIAVFCDILNIVMVTMSFAMAEEVMANKILILWAVLTTFGTIFVIMFILRPMMLWIITIMPVDRPVDQKYIIIILLSVLIFGFISEAIGQHYIFGPIFLGLIVPEGPPLGAALVSRLDTFISGVLYPSYLAISGLQTNIHKINPREMWIVGILVLIGIAVKTGTVMVAAKSLKLSRKNAFVLAMILNSKGVLELTVFNFWKDNKLLQQEEFTVCIISVVATTAIITPLVRKLYDPSKECLASRRNTIHHSRQDSEFRVLVCIHKPENVPTIVNLLEVSHATKESPVATIALVLVELIGRNTPLLISNDHFGSQHSDTSAASRITNALKHYEQNNEGCTTVQSFTSISQFDTMHLDIFRLAIDRKATILIVPFHKQWAIDGSVDSSSSCIRQMNRKILEKAPCSVGILIDRGILTGSVSVRTSLSKYNVGVIFLGGPDDTESLAYGARMSRHPSVILTVIWFLLFGSENSTERKRDTELIYQYKKANMGNDRFIYVEEVVRDGVGLSQCIGKIVNYFNLILVGRSHQNSPLFTALEDWSECPELGIIGDMLASPDMKTTASVLVVQQQRPDGKEAARGKRSHVVPESWPISIENECKSFR